jgi:hypothetical protein
MTSPINEATVPVFDLIRQWGSDRNLILGATPQAQFVKLCEEFGEVTLGMEEDNYAEIKDGLGDTAVVLTILASQMGTTIEECFEYAVGMERTFVYFDDETEYSAYIRAMSTQFGKLATGIAKKNAPLAKEALGHALGLVSALSGCLLVEEGFDDALLASYNVIKDRKGKMIDGIFVKEADLHMVGGQ